VTTPADELRNESASLASAKRINPICDEFERAWREGQRPEIQQYLDRVPSSMTWTLLQELIKLDLFYRSGRTVEDTIILDEYAGRFSVFADRIRGLFLPNHPEVPSSIPSSAPGDDARPRRELRGPARTFSVGSRSLSHLGKYELLEEVGKGGMGIVFKARQPGLDRDVALKVLLELTPDRVERFKREWRIAGKLVHHAIVQAYDADNDDGIPYLVMEFVEGVDLRQLSSHCGELLLADACELIRQAALGLQYAHTQGLVHRDIKPSNLMLSNEGGVKVLDLGLARLRTETGPVGVATHSGALLGTFAYMAPEQATDPRKADIRADVYSLGCTLFKLLTTRSTFGSRDCSVPQLLVAHRSDPIPDIRLIRPDVPNELARIITLMLAKAPEDRPQSPGDVAQLLSPFTADCNLAELAVIARTAVLQSLGIVADNKHKMIAAVEVAPTRSYVYLPDSTLPAGPGAGQTQAPRVAPEIPGRAHGSLISQGSDFVGRHRQWLAAGVLILVGVFAVGAWWHFTRRSIPLLDRSAFDLALKSDGWIYGTDGVRSPNGPGAWIRVSGPLPAEFKLQILVEHQQDGHRYSMVNISQENPFVICVTADTGDVAGNQADSHLRAEPPKLFVSNWGDLADNTSRQFLLSVGPHGIELKKNGKVEIDWREGFVKAVDWPDTDLPKVPKEKEHGFYLHTSNSSFRFRCFREPVDR
jgi:serine/threonine protein kinase